MDPSLKLKSKSGREGVNVSGPSRTKQTKSKSKHIVVQGAGWVNRSRFQRNEERKQARPLELLQVPVMLNLDGVR
jgi:hypothetical protein